MTIDYKKRITKALESVPLIIESKSPEKALKYIERIALAQLKNLKGVENKRSAQKRI